MQNNMVIVGGGLGGLATAVAAAQAGMPVQLLEQASQFAEVGAGVQLGPNAMRVLQSWGLAPAIQAVAAFPERLQVRNLHSGQVLGTLHLGARAVARYGAAHATLARADVHRVLLDAAQSLHIPLQTQTQLTAVQETADSVQLTLASGASGQTVSTPLLVAADGLWSRVRTQVLPDAQPRASGHWAFRAMVKQSSLPSHARSQLLTVWLAPQMHGVQYPVRGGEWMNLVIIAQNTMQNIVQSGLLQPGPLAKHPHAAAPATVPWDGSAPAAQVHALLAVAHGALRDAVLAVDDWRMWPLYDRPPMAHSGEQARGRIALLGDAAHPMLPYLAQGAGMALEDAQQLIASLQANPDVPGALHHYANARWARNARVQARAARNGQIFHLSGPLRVGRDAALRLLGNRLMDMPWLYGYQLS
jgi:salicylate hydroxylase